MVQAITEGLKEKFCVWTTAWVFSSQAVYKLSGNWKSFKCLSVLRHSSRGMWHYYWKYADAQWQLASQCKSIKMNRYGMINDIQIGEKRRTGLSLTVE